MRLTVLLFAGLRQRAGRAELVVEIDPSPAPTLLPTVADLRRAIVAGHPELGPIDHCRFAIDQEFAADDRQVDPAAEIALIPPVSGGSGAAPDPDPDSWAGCRSRLSRRPIALAEVVAAVEHRDAGGIATFTGNVREASRGKRVLRLEYEAYAPMAVRVMDAIATAIEQEIPGTRVAIAHRIGALVVGESAVVIAASAAHRDEAFRACRETIERLKQDVPIWKKEIDDEGGEWIGRGP